MLHKDAVYSGLTDSNLNSIITINFTNFILFFAS